jgi:carbon storage regulator CsrA
MALVLSRKQNESIVFLKDGHADIKVTVIGWAKYGNSWTVRLAIHAPESVQVVREELLFRDDPWRGREPSVSKDQVRD